MRKNAQILLVTLVALVVLSLTAIIGISLISSKEISFSKFISRAGGWFSSTISSLEYGLYKLNFQNVPPESEISIPYFSEDNLIPFFKAPFTITIYGEQYLPVVYEGYFGFKDLFYPVQWIFNWLVTREKGEIKEVKIGQASALYGLYYYYDDTRKNCLTALPNLFKKTYAAVQSDVYIICGNSYTVLNDLDVNTGKLLGDDPSNLALENYIAEIVFDQPRYVNYVTLYAASSINPSTYIAVSYYPTASNQTPIEVASTTVINQIVNLPINQNTQKLRVELKPYVENNYTILTEFRAYGY